MIVPSPNDEDRAESAATRPLRRVLRGEIGLGRRRRRAAQRAVDRAEDAEQDEGQRRRRSSRAARRPGPARTAASRR